MEKPQGRQEKLHVLMVEDSKVMRDAMSMVLESHVPRLHLTTAGSRQEALEKIGELESAGRLPHIVITDLRLTGTVKGA